MQFTRVIKCDILVPHSKGLPDIDRTKSTNTGINLDTGNNPVVEHLDKYFPFSTDTQEPRQSETSEPKIKLELLSLSGLETTIDIMVPDRRVEKRLIHNLVLTLEV